MLMKWTTNYKWNIQNLAGETTNDATTVYSYDMRGVITSKRDGELTRYVKDPHGNVIAASKDNNVLDEYEYSAYGELLNGGATSNPFRYCGEYYDTELDSIYLRNRYYTPSTGRFLTEDPIKDGMNWYSYCGGEPLMLIDPSGCLSILPDGTIHTNKNDNSTNVQLLQLKINYVNATSDWQRREIAEEAEQLRNVTTEEIKVYAWQDLEDFELTDATYAIMPAFIENAREAASHPLDFKWFYNMVNHEEAWDVKLKDAWEAEFGIEYPTETGEVWVDLGGEEYILTPEEIGNIMYGYTGSAAWYPPQVLYAGGGVAAAGAVGALKDGYPYWGDSIDDHEAVKKGIDLWNILH